MTETVGQLRLKLEAGPWEVARDGDASCRAIFRRHYSYRPYADGRDSKLFVGPGGKLVLVSAKLDALFVWRKFIDDAIPKQTGINCAVFRNEGPILSSSLILEAEPYAWSRWPEETRLYTYVNESKIRSSNPGCCFLKAGWRRIGKTKTGKVILTKPRGV